MDDDELEPEHRFNLPILLSPTVRKLQPQMQVLTADAHNYTYFNDINVPDHSINIHTMPLQRSSSCIVQPLIQHLLPNKRVRPVTDSPMLPDMSLMSTATTLHPLATGFSHLISALEASARLRQTPTHTADNSNTVRMYSGMHFDPSGHDAGTPLSNTALMDRMDCTDSVSSDMAMISTTMSVASIPTVSSSHSIMACALSNPDHHSHGNTNFNMAASNSAPRLFQPQNQLTDPAGLFHSSHDHDASLNPNHTHVNASHSFLHHTFESSHNADLNNFMDSNNASGSLQLLYDITAQKATHPTSTQSHLELGKRKRDSSENVQSNMDGSASGLQAHQVDTSLNRSIFAPPSKMFRAATTALTSRFAQCLNVEENTESADMNLGDTELSQATSSSTSNLSSDGRAFVWPNKFSFFGGLGKPSTTLVRKTSLASNIDSDSGISVPTNPVQPSCENTEIDVVLEGNEDASLHGSTRSATIQAHIIALSHSYGIHLPVMQRMWEDKRRELKSNLSMLWYGISNDSYDDVKLITQNVLEAAHWLSNRDLSLLRELIPIWHLAEHKLNGIIKYIQVAEDIKFTVQQSVSATAQSNVSQSYSIFHPTSNLAYNTESLMQFLISKHELYGNIIRQEGLPWRVLGVPMEELDPLFNAFGKLLHQVVGMHLIRVHAEVEAFEKSRADNETMALADENDLNLCVLNSVDILAKVCQLIGFCVPLPPQLEELALHLCTFYASQSVKEISTLCKRDTADLARNKRHSTGNINSFDSQSMSRSARSSDAKIAYCVEKMIRLMTHIKTISANSENGILPGAQVSEPYQARLLVKSPVMGQRHSDPSLKQTQVSTKPSNVLVDTCISSLFQESAGSNTAFYSPDSTSLTPSESIPLTRVPALTMLTRPCMDALFCDDAVSYSAVSLSEPTTSLFSDPLSKSLAQHQNRHYPNQHGVYSTTFTDTDLDSPIPGHMRTPVYRACVPLSTSQTILPTVEKFSALLVEAGLMLCEHASQSRILTPVTDTAESGGHLMTGFACRFIFAVFHLVEQDLDSDLCDWMHRLVRQLIPEENPVFGNE
ncbi:hypothetical protein BATDEDRAFT_35605 [Batrachochytrium dendrobatidis JAM81]|uniref:Uncharacterized protein n=1 Tax=Batrachochytrium dendrobatidis (strain JAM81 / FGSC 10211) TaxID=684364 RepID=F4P7H7_BATDJ|nr:uncharacterized protein BATDEDRAFT_35605 [Batrachochytrium dendrobatidis JAM81]EGF78945.1 hypothetical protein BATDEDRAFT_35605 [Batrachochytrium dendrobatidis JAM81]|eukprot:XP_006680431.1 hypothetical protein BATDEDRAFT_35605 [Batrachochytrium dendrobatidis JAM81]